MNKSGRTFGRIYFDSAMDGRDLDFRTEGRMETAINMTVNGTTATATTVAWDSIALEAPQTFVKVAAEFKAVRDQFKGYAWQSRTCQEDC